MEPTALQSPTTPSAPSDRSTGGRAASLPAPRALAPMTSTTPPASAAGSTECILMTYSLHSNVSHIPSLIYTGTKMSEMLPLSLTSVAIDTLWFEKSNISEILNILWLVSSQNLVYFDPLNFHNSLGNVNNEMEKFDKSSIAQTCIARLC